MSSEMILSRKLFHQNINFCFVVTSSTLCIYFIIISFNRIFIFTFPWEFLLVPFLPRYIFINHQAGERKNGIAVGDYDYKGELFRFFCLIMLNTHLFCKKINRIVSYEKPPKLFSMFHVFFSQSDLMFFYLHLFLIAGENNEVNHQAEQLNYD